MSDLRGFRLAWAFVALTGLAGAGLFLGGAPVGASEDHERVQMLRERGDVLPLAEILNRAGLAGQRVLEAELEEEHGRLVYELETLDEGGRVIKGYYDAATGEPLGRKWDD